MERLSADINDTEEPRADPRAAAKISVMIKLNGVDAGRGVSLNLSAGGVAIASPAFAEVGDVAQLAFAGGAVLEGAVVRIFRGGFAVSFQLHEGARARLRAAIDAMITEEARPKELLLDRRASPRTPCPRIETLMRCGGREIRCWVDDISLTGASVITPERLSIGERVTLGVASGRIVARRGGTYGVEFERSAMEGWA
ncbi:MAG: PilZ domain-containing protein [Pseudomonadota bacterium]